jgi:tRNA-specific 2-thiouridylase
MLAGLEPASLARLRFPLGGLTKPQVRRIAAEAGLFAARRPDSQDLCFLAGTSREAFLARHGGLTDQPGDIVDLEGRVLGSHRGVHHFTVGQRRGIGIVGREPLYVLRMLPRERRLVVGTREQLAETRVPLAGVRLLRAGGRVDRVKLRYKAEPLQARIVQPAKTGRHRRLDIQLLEAGYGVAPGQTACLMESDRVVGLGTIAPK